MMELLLMKASIVIHTGGSNKYQDAETVEDMLSLESMEKFMIKKALKKYNNRRKEAADELGISERTLYRKIKEYDIPD
ncbi:MAG: helix-turn-helix domain-containing protein [Saprospiraceae bacterium]|nr:helix-turn-helix domain-containing protein [Saprospiraceae bacterium]